MKALRNYIILFDAECPICRVITRSVIVGGLVEKGSDLPYQQYDNESCFYVDRQRAVNEIALINKTTGEVTYGVESLFKILGSAIPLLNPLFKFKPFIWLMSKAYGLFSYNRRVIFPVKSAHTNTLQPGFKLSYRLTYIILTWCIAGFILTHYVPLIFGALSINIQNTLYILLGVQVFFQALIISVINKSKALNYLGNLMTAYFAGTLLLLPVLLLGKYIYLNPPVYAVCFLVAVLFMLFEHIRRAKLLETGWIPTITWACYILFTGYLVTT